jgi:methylase of polypeptide subunit release factors
MNNNLAGRGIQDTQTLIKLYLQNIIQDGDLAIDATAGRGRDTLFLAQCVGSKGKVFAFDIQREAISATEALLKAHGLAERVELFTKSHDEICLYIKNRIKAAIFNLGYLPGSDQGIVTRADRTIAAVRQVLNLLENRGVVVLTVYRGHEGGLEESRELTRFLSEFPKKNFSVLQGIYLNQGELSPYWIMIQKNREDLS